MQLGRSPLSRTFGRQKPNSPIMCFASLLLDVFCPRNYSRRFMNRTLRFVLPLTMLALLLFPHRAPAPIIYRDGEGFSSADLSDIEIKKNAEEQFKLAERYEAAGRLQACRRFLSAGGHGGSRDPISRPKPSSNPGKCSREDGKLQRAFQRISVLVQKYPRSPDFEAALQAQYNIGKAYLDGKADRYLRGANSSLNDQGPGDVPEDRDQRPLQPDRTVSPIRNRPGS